MKIKNYGMMSEVWDDSKIVFVGNASACDQYMSGQQVVGENEFGEPITRQVMKEYFNLVADKEDWKNSVARIVGDVTVHERNMIEQAVTFFTGSVVKWSYKCGKNYIEFDGYYKAIGA